MMSVEEHKIKFENKVNKEKEKKDKNSRMLSKIHYENARKCCQTTNFLTII